MKEKSTLLEKLADGGLHRIDGQKVAAVELQKARKLYVTEIGGSFYACLFPRSEKARLQEDLARHKVAYYRQAHTPGRDQEAARAEAEIASQFRAIGLPPSYPIGFL